MTQLRIWCDSRWGSSITIIEASIAPLLQNDSSINIRISLWEQHIHMCKQSWLTILFSPKFEPFLIIICQIHILRCYTLKYVMEFSLGDVKNCWVTFWHIPNQGQITSDSLDNLIYAIRTYHLTLKPTILQSLIIACLIKATPPPITAQVSQGFF